jgi:hypothetical protein
MSAKSYAYLRVVIVCVLLATCGVLYGISAAHYFKPSHQARLTVAVLVTFLFCFYCIVKPPPRGLLGSTSSPLFTCLVVVCIGIPLAILAWPGCSAVWDAQVRRGLEDRLKQIGLAMHAYHDREHHFPPSTIYGKDGKPLLSWRVALLPSLGHEDLYRQFKLDEPWDSPHNLALAAQMPDVYGLPQNLDDPAEPNTTYFQVFVGPGTAFEGKDGISIRDFPDGTSGTVLVVIAPEPVLWTKPADIEFLLQGPLVHPNTRIYWSPPTLFADGSVGYVERTDELLRAQIMRNSGKPRAHPW